MIISDNATGRPVIQAAGGFVKPLSGNITAAEHLRRLRQDHVSPLQISLVVPAQEFGGWEEARAD